MAAGPLRSSAFQKGRGGVTDVTGRSGASGLSISGSSRKLPVFLVRRSLRRLRTSFAFRAATLLDGIRSSIWRLGSSSFFFSSLCERRKILPTSQNCFEIKRTTKWWWNLKFSARGALPVLVNLSTTALWYGFIIEKIILVLLSS